MCLRDRAERAGWADVRGLGPPRASLLPDPPDGANGQEGRHLETPGFRRLRAQTGQTVAITRHKKYKMNISDLQIVF